MRKCITHFPFPLIFLVILWFSHNSNTLAIKQNLHLFPNINEIDLEQKNPENTVGCIEPGSNKVCSGKGQCKNDKCHCESYEFDDVNNTQVFYAYSGQYCEECPYCRGQRCARFMPCIECKLFPTTSTTVTEPTSCEVLCQYVAISVQEVDRIERNVENDDKICEVESLNGCFVQFQYFIKGNGSVQLEYRKTFYCGFGTTILACLFWGVIGYLLLLMVIIPKLYSKTTYKSCQRSRTKSLPTSTNFEMYYL